MRFQGSKEASVYMKTGRSFGWTEVICAALVLTFLAGLSFSDDADQGLLKKAQQLFGVLPTVMESSQNPVTPEKVKLGKMLFYNRGSR